MKLSLSNEMSRESEKVPENGKDQGAKTKHDESCAANSNIHHLHPDDLDICKGVLPANKEATRVFKGLQYETRDTRQSEVLVVHCTGWSALLTNTARRGWRMNRANASFVLSREK